MIRNLNSGDELTFAGSLQRTGRLFPAVILETCYIPKFFGILLVAAVPSYIIMIYGDLLLSVQLFNFLNYVVIGPAILAELIQPICLLQRTGTFYFSITGSIGLNCLLVSGRRSLFLH